MGAPKKPSIINMQEERKGVGVRIAIHNSEIDRRCRKCGNCYEGECYDSNWRVFKGRGISAFKIALSYIHILEADRR